MMRMAECGSGLLGSEDWSDFFDAVFDEKGGADFVVAIARKMPRICECLDRVQGAPYPVVSERALPWMGDLRGGNSYGIFCDDILNVGSTVTHYLDYALANGLRRAKVVVYARREHMRARLEQAKLGQHHLTVIRPFDEEAYWRFETALPQALQCLGKPYDLDFPILSVPLSKGDAIMSPEEWRERLTRLFPSVHDLTTPTQRAAGVCSLSIMDPLEVSLRDLLSVSVAGHVPTVKVRVYVSERDGVARIVPMCIPPVKADELTGPGRFIDHNVDRFFSEFSRNARDAAPFRLEPIYNLLVYLLSFEYGRVFLPHFRRLLEYDTAARPSVSRSDLRLLFGSVVLDELQLYLDERLQLPPTEVAVRESALEPKPPKEPFHPELVQQAVTELTRGGYRAAPTTELIREVMRVWDNLTEANDPRRESELDYARLRRGFSLCDLWWIARTLQGATGPSSFAHMSFLLDYYVDLGVIVPVVGMVHNIYWRVYRRGEADPVQYSSFLHGLLQRHEKKWPDSPLDTTAFSKIIAAHAIYHRGVVPIDPFFWRLGTVGFVRQSEAVEQHTLTMLDFLHNKGIISFDSPKAEDDKQQRLF